MNDAHPRAVELVLQLGSHFRTIVLGTAGADGEPAASVVAAILDESGAFIVYVSGLAVHTRHLQANPRASVLVVEDESATANPFARRRLTFACRVVPVEPATDDHRTLAAALRAKFGDIIDVLASLPDFQLVRLIPQRGRLVAGFGAAFEVGPAGWHRAETLQLHPVRPAG
jgi:putative heme iron utilization protein